MDCSHVPELICALQPLLSNIQLTACERQCQQPLGFNQSPPKLLGLGVQFQVVQLNHAFAQLDVELQSQTASHATRVVGRYT